MSDVRWIKIVTDIFDDDKILLIESMPDADALIVIWFKLLCLAGKQNNSGVFLLNDRIPYTEEMFATIFRRPLNTIRLALKTFEDFGMIEIINGTVTIPNWGKHQNFDKIEAKNEYMREYMREYREKQRLLSDGNANSKTNSKSNVSEAEKNRVDKNREEYTSSFDEFYSVYPKKKARQDALKAWLALKPDRALIETIVADVQAKRESEWKGKDMQYIPYPATYLRGKRWEDEQSDDSTGETSNDSTPDFINHREHKCIDGDERKSLYKQMGAKV